MGSGVVNSDGPASRAGSAPDGIRVLIVSAVRLFRDGIAQALDHPPRFHVVGTARTSQEAIARLGAQAADVALIDLALPGGLLLVREARDIRAEVKVVVLSVPDAEPDVIACVEAGAAGFVTVEGSLDDLSAVLESVGRGETLCSPRMAAALLRRVNALAERRGGALCATLTARERQIIRLLEYGLSNKEIARELQIELPTVKNHVHNILGKLQVARRSDVAARFRGGDIAVHARPAV
jgi:DNA-binding NarL/FixJ family response regulator